MVELDVIKKHRLPTETYPKGMLKVAVIGGNGFLGRHFIQRLASSYKNLDIYSLDSNKYGIYLKNFNNTTTVNQVTMPVHIPGTIKPWLWSHRPDIVVFMAGREGPANGLNRLCNITEDTEALVALMRTLDIVSDIKPEYFLYVSSASVYGNHGRKLVDETSKLKPNNHVGQIRVAAEQIVADYCSAMNHRYAIVRPTQIYGRHNWLELLDSNYWPGFVSYYVDRAVEVLEYKVTGKKAPGDTRNKDDLHYLFTPTSMVDLVHVDYVTEVLEKLCLERAGGIYNISSGAVYSLQEIVETLSLSIQEHPALPYEELKTERLTYNKKDITKRSHSLVASDKIHSVIPYPPEYSIRNFFDQYVPIRMKEIREHKEYVEAVLKTNVLDTTGVYGGAPWRKKDD